MSGLTQKQKAEWVWNIRTLPHGYGRLFDEDTGEFCALGALYVAMGWDYSWHGDPNYAKSGELIGDQLVNQIINLNDSHQMAADQMAEWVERHVPTADGDTKP